MPPSDRQTKLNRSRLVERGVIMAEESKDAIAEYHRRAEEARRMAETAVDPIEKADFLAIEQRWLSLARDQVSDAED
jgi:hypothetical protein